MNVWTLCDDASASADAAQAALIGMISHLGSPGFTTGGLRELNLALEAGSWSVYRVRRTQPPVCYLSSSFRRLDTTGACFQVYRDHLYRRDRTFDALGEDGAPRLKAIHLRATEVPDPEHRLAIYERHQIRERLSVARQCADESILSVNLYRHADQGRFRERDIEVFAALAPSLFALVERQIVLHEQLHPSSPAGEDRRTCLSRLAPAMPARELDVCERLLEGMSHDGIACDLGISVTTVKTYRNRAFERLGIHHNNELFALVLRAGGMPR